MKVFKRNFKPSIEVFAEIKRRKLVRYANVNVTKVTTKGGDILE